MNPFSVAIAQGIADVPLLSGAPFRMTMWLVFTAVGVVFTMRHASAIKATSSESSIDTLNSLSQGQFTKVDSIILSIFWVSHCMGYLGSC